MTAFDVVIVGGGASGATAAARLASTGHRVALLDHARFPGESSALYWLNARAATTLSELGVTDKALPREEFHRVTFHSADFAKTIEPKLPRPAGFLVDRHALDHVLVRRAAKQGAAVQDACAVKDILLKESSVHVQVKDGETVEGRILILAPGSGSPLLQRVGLTREAAPAYWSALVHAPLEKRRSEAAVAIVWGLDRYGSFGILCLGRNRFSIAAHAAGEKPNAIPFLKRLCTDAHRHGLVPRDLTESASKAGVTASPAGHGLDMDTHVAKHTLVIGAAGGFVAAASNEGLYPGMWSAVIAAEVVEETLRAAKKGAPVQDQLMRFDTAWRTHMADYLRSPHTDIQFLLPLIFANQPMADRMAAAFFFGENI